MNKKIIFILSLATVVLAVFFSIMQYLQAQEFKKAYSDKKYIAELEERATVSHEIMLQEFNCYFSLFISSYSHTDAFKAAHAESMLRSFFWFWCLQEEGLFTIAPKHPPSVTFRVFKALLNPYAELLDLSDPWGLKDKSPEEQVYELEHSIGPLKFTMRQYEDAAKKFGRTWDTTEIKPCEAEGDVPCAD